MNTIKIWGVAYKGKHLGDHRPAIGTVRRLSADGRPCFGRPSPDDRPTVGRVQLTNINEVAD